MNNIIKFFDFTRTKLKYLLLAYTAINIYMNSKTTYINYTILIGLDIFLIIYTLFYSKMTVLKKNDILFIMTSIIIYCFIWGAGCSDNIYYYILLDYIFEIHDKKIRNAILVFHYAGFMGVILLHSFKIQSFVNNPIDFFETLIYSFVIYGIVLLVFILVHNIKEERDKLKLLNSNLIEYSFKEREFLISEERSRISQELHDSIGHSLMALSMNIRYLRAIKDKKAIDKEIDEIDLLVKESIETLRNTVYSLRELDKDYEFKKEIENMIKKFNDLNMVKINFDCEIGIEKADSNLKNILLTTIKEGITNSIKHAAPSQINISLELVNSNIKLLIEDNGQGCEIINKSHGLNGIIERFQKFNGEVYFESKKNKGFTIKVLVPGGFLND